MGYFRIILARLRNSTNSWGAALLAVGLLFLALPQPRLRKALRKSHLHNPCLEELALPHLFIMTCKNEFSWTCGFTVQHVDFTWISCEWICSLTVSGYKKNIEEYQKELLFRFCEAKSSRVAVSDHDSCDQNAAILAAQWQQNSHACSTRFAMLLSTADRYLDTVMATAKIFSAATNSCVLQRSTASL